MPKTLKTFRLSEEAIKRLSELAEADSRSEAFIVEQLILNTPKPKKSGKIKLPG